ncbi:adenylyl-sulfate kinase [Cohnella suwonensis]|uniref:Adenylyl-sulfate kinase n=1 Tax=Cohnella suwonensis TaxID=696072 RepID=A0ABW0LUJ9_9BACL
MKADRKRERRDAGGFVVWFTGLSGSGKTTLALEAERELAKHGALCVVLDGDRLRQGLNSDLGYTEEDRAENLRRAAEVAVLFAEKGFIVLAPMISPSEKARSSVRERFDSERYAEVYVKCTLDGCERRDPKGLYRRARAGEIANFTGVDATYELPSRAELTIDKEEVALASCSAELIRYIEHRYDNLSKRRGERQ